MKLNVLQISLLIFLFGVCDACNDNATPATTTTNSSKPAPATFAEDSAKITVLIKNMYQWYESSSSKGEFSPVEPAAKDSHYKSIDQGVNDKRMQEIKSSGFFAKEFLDNYNKIAQTIDQELKSGKTTWLTGDMPPYGSDADPWCACQDSPEQYWNQLIFTGMKIQNNSASCSWNWADEKPYLVKLVKENGNWKIAYLEGFDYVAYTQAQ